MCSSLLSMILLREKIIITVKKQDILFDIVKAMI